MWLSVSALYRELLLLEIVLVINLHIYHVKYINSVHLVVYKNVGRYTNTIKWYGSIEMVTCIVLVNNTLHCKCIMNVLQHRFTWCGVRERTSTRETREISDTDKDPNPDLKLHSREIITCTLNSNTNSILKDHTNAAQCNNNKPTPNTIITLYFYGNVMYIFWRNIFKSTIREQIKEHWMLFNTLNLTSRKHGESLFRLIKFSTLDYIKLRLAALK